MLKHTVISDGRCLMTVYDFELVDDVLAEHAHDATTVHYSIVAAGVVKIFGAGQPEQVMPAGTVLRIEAGADHGFIALAPRSRLINIVYGMQA